MPNDRAHIAVMSATSPDRRVYCRIVVPDMSRHVGVVQAVQGPIPNARWIIRIYLLM